MIELTVSESVVMSVIGTLAFGFLAWMAVASLVMSYAICFHAGEPKAPVCFKVGLFYVAPAVSVAVMVAVNTVKIVWTP